MKHAVNIGAAFATHLEKAPQVRTHFACFTGTKDLLYWYKSTKLHLRRASRRCLRYALCLLFWYKSTNTDAGGLQRVSPESLERFAAAVRKDLEEVLDEVCEQWEARLTKPLCCLLNLCSMLLTKPPSRCAGSGGRQRRSKKSYTKSAI